MMIRDPKPESPWIPLWDHIVMIDVTPPTAILMPETAKRNPADVRLEVIAAGPDCKQAQIGDCVLIGRDVPVGGHEVKGERFFITSEEFITAVWKDSRNTT